MPETIAALHPYFDIIEMSPPDCPVHCSAVFPNASTFDRWPAFPEAATPSRGRVASGRGTTREDCLASGLGEAAELASSCAWGNEKLVFASIREIGPEALDPAALLGLSASQMWEREAWNAEHGDFDWRPAPCPLDRKIAWVYATEATTGKNVPVPADAVYIGRREANDAEAVVIADSNGCASGRSVANAKLSALLELVERDATGRWWYGLRDRPTLSLDLLDPNPDLRRALSVRQRRTVMFDISTDINVPCVAAVSSEQDGKAVSVGFAADFDIAKAAISAIAEMIQIEISLRAACAAEEPHQLWRTWLQDVSMALPMMRVTEVQSTPAQSAPPHPQAAVDLLVIRCEEAKCRVLFVDLTRPEFDVPTYRALSPDLCHYKPRFGRQRLLAADRSDIVGPENRRDVPNRVFLSV